MTRSMAENLGDFAASAATRSRAAARTHSFTGGLGAGLGLT